MSSGQGDWECNICYWTNRAGIRRCADCGHACDRWPAHSRPALSQLSPNVALDAQLPSPKGMGALHESLMATEALMPLPTPPSSPGWGSTPDGGGGLEGGGGLGGGGVIEG